MAAGKSVHFKDTLEEQREEEIYDQFLNQYQLVEGQNGLIPIGTEFTIQYIFHDAFPSDSYIRETFQVGILMPENEAIQKRLSAGENVIAMPPEVFNETLREIKKHSDTIQIELISSDPEPFFTTTAPDGKVMGFYTYDDATGNHKAQQVIEALRDDTAQRSIERDEKQNSIHKSVILESMQSTRGQQSLFDSSQYITDLPPPEMPYKRYRLLTPRNMLAIMSSNLNPELAKEMG
jgi:hypothetical protein